jgi:hypothetical protein
MVRKVSPWSVFKVSLIFYACLMLVVLGALLILYALLSGIGAISSLEQLADNLGFGPGFRVNGGWLFARGLGIGIAMVVIWSLINVFVAFLYNLISDLVGGIEITLAERR